jgi:hypothetical protein
MCFRHGLFSFYKSVFPFREEENPELLKNRLLLLSGRCHIVFCLTWNKKQLFGVPTAGKFAYAFKSISVR